MSAAETHRFQTEARQLLKLMIHSLYSNKEVFLRELISNASDAIDRLRFAALDDPALIDEGADYEIRVEFDAEAGTITVSDNGIGMNHDEIIANLGTIARSGTAEFLAELSGDRKKDAALIGQFGVGFYSAFIVAERVEVVTRKAGHDGALRWRSSGEDEYEIEAADRDTRGTDVVLTLKAEAKDFADGFRLRHIIRKYSDHIGVPIRMRKAGEDDEPGDEWETVNHAQALWTRPRTEISDEEYKSFYQHVSHDFDEPLIWSHNKVEGKLEYTSLLYVPRRAPFDLFNRDAPRGVKLYVQRVFIMDDAEQFLPLYLRFVKGVVDASDLPLNVSREILQEDPRVQTIRSALTKRVLDLLDKLARENAEGYQTFWNELGTVLKEGPAEDFANREAIAGLIRFASTHDDTADETTSLADYVGRMAVDQKQIYYLAADSFAAAKASPHLEVLRERGLEVLLLSDRIDDWFMNALSEFDGKPLEDITRSGLELPGEPEQPEGDDKEKNPLCERVAAALGDRVASVVPSKRLTDSPACLVLGEHDLGTQMRRIMEAAGQRVPEAKPNLEINVGHPLITRMDAATDEDRFGELAALLLDQAFLAEGRQPDDPSGYVGRLNRLLLELL